MTLDETLDLILQNEGGWTNNPKDRGGPTNMGITLATFSAYLGRQATIQELQNLSVADAKEIYTRRYISGPRIDTLPTEIIPILADASVLYGPGRAIIFLQRVINQAGFGIVDVDGVIGPMTRNAAQNCFKAMSNAMVNAIVQERLIFNQHIVDCDETQSIFLDGWNNRAKKFEV